MKLEFNFDWICHDIEFELSLLRDFYNDMQKSIPSMSAKFEADMGTYLSTIQNDEEYRAMSSTVLTEQYVRFEDFYPNRLAYNYLISLYSSIESNMSKLCDDIAERRTLPFSADGFAGDLPDRLRRFFLSFGLPPMEDQEVQFLKELTKLRNVIVHHAGKIPEEQQRLRNIIENTKGLEIDDEKVVIDFAYCSEIWDNTMNMFQSMFRRLGYRTDFTVTTSP
ncbi:MAG: hypothetical protein HC888_09565 [Candidatus Competibacteraceae bacterium]|nr:hypothetical protein [Candidatus Competibacteraceae bacterium]